MSLVIADHMLIEIGRYLRQLVPNEGCGVIAGTDDELTDIHYMRNTNRIPHNEFHFDMQQMAGVYSDIEDAGYKVRVIFHSHTYWKAGAEPSVVDVRTMKAIAGTEDGQPDVIAGKAVWVIYDLSSPSNTAVKAWRVEEDGTLVEVDLEVVETLEADEPAHATSSS